MCDFLSRHNHIWSATFEPEGLPMSEAEQIFEAALSANSRALKQFLER